MSGSHSTRFACSWQAIPLSESVAGKTWADGASNALSLSKGFLTGVQRRLFSVHSGQQIAMSELFPAIPAPATVAGFAFVYILQSVDGSLYIGQTRNLTERLRKHRYGLGAKFTSDHTTPRLVYCEGPMSPDAGVTREAQLKRWSRAKKEALIRGDLPVLKTLSRSRTASPSQARHHDLRPDPI